MMDFMSFNDVDGSPKILAPDPYIVVLCGLPGSGKSTLRAMLSNTAVELSTDDYVESMAKWRGTTYDALWESEIKAATASVESSFKLAVRERRSIIWDQTNLTVKKRRKIISQIPPSYYKCAIFVTVDEAVRQERLKSRVGKKIPAHVDESMRKNLSIPTMSEGFDEVFTITMGPHHTSMKKRDLVA